MSYKRFLPRTTVLMLIALFIITACGAPKPASVTIYYEGNAQVELIDPEGQRVLIDVYKPSALSSPAVEEDILLTTHGHHTDHVHEDFLRSFPGQQLYVKEGNLDLPDVSIQGIASSHVPGGPDTFKPEGGSNYLFIVDIGGLRIAHFGDIGQDGLTQEQLDALGEVDIAITQLSNSYSEMNVQNKKAFNLMAQVNPKLIIPTHINEMEAIEYAMEVWGVFATNENKVVIERSDLPDETQLLIMGEPASFFLQIYDLPEWQ